LLFTQLKKDSSWLRPALADFILLFRNEGENETPIHPDIENNEWIEWARPIWYNIRESDTLNAAAGRHTDDERHIAPLQLGTIERCIRLWSNKGETVFSPFAGIGSEGWVALKTGRRFSGVELKDSYWNAAVKNLTKAAEQADQPRMALMD
jgi:DNA modification methylase